MFHISGFFFVVGLYFLPTLIAIGRNLPSRGGIAMLNLFFGWTFIGWIASLVWAVTAPSPYVVYVHRNYPPYPPFY